MKYKKLREELRTIRGTQNAIDFIIDNELIPENGPFSFSSLNLCPFTYKKLKIDGEEGATITRFDTEEGTFMHLLADYDVHIRLNTPPEDWMSVEDIVDNLCKVHPEAEPFLPQLTDNLHKFRFNFGINKNAYVGSEMQLAADFEMNDVDWDSERAWYRGKVDYLEISGNTARVVDYKNYPTIHPDDEFNDLHQSVGRQATGYGSMVMALFPQITEFYYEVYYFRFGFSKVSSYKDDDGEKQLRLVTKEEIDAWWRVNQRRMLAMERRTTYPPIPSQKNCQYCPVSAMCDWYVNGRNANDILISEDKDAEDMIQELRVLEEQRKRIRGSLDTFVKDKKGKVRVGELEYGYEEYERRSVNTRKALEACAKAGIDPAKYVTISPTNSSKLIDMMEGEAKELMEEAITEELTTRKIRF